MFIWGASAAAAIADDPWLADRGRAIFETQGVGLSDPESSSGLGFSVSIFAPISSSILWSMFLESW